MTHSPPLPAPTLVDHIAHLRRLAELAARRSIHLNSTDIDALLAVCAACELAYSSVPAVAGEGPA